MTNIGIQKVQEKLYALVPRFTLLLHAHGSLVTLEETLQPH